MSNLSNESKKHNPVSENKKKKKKSGTKNLPFCRFEALVQHRRRNPKPDLNAAAKNTFKWRGNYAPKPFPNKNPFDKEYEIELCRQRRRTTKNCMIEEDIVMEIRVKRRDGGQ